jgi:S-DNA-T family DNA segregation ATPase FtsK/SpoIIIE
MVAFAIFSDQNCAKRQEDKGLTTQYDMRPRLASPQFVAQMIRRLAELFGLGLWVVAVAAGLALASFAPGDPSLNFATGAAVHNVLGANGAVFADAVFRSLGWAALYLPVLLAAWGWRLVVGHRLPFWRYRLAVAPVAWLLIAMTLGGTAWSGPFFVPEGAGGAVGALTLGHLIEALLPAGISAGLTFSVVAGAATLLGLWALALDIAELALAAQLLRRAVGVAFRLSGRSFGWSLRRVPRPKLLAFPKGLFSRRARSEPPPVHSQHPSTPWAPPTASAPRAVPLPLEPMPEHKAPVPELQSPQPKVGIDVRSRPGTQSGSRQQALTEPPLPLGDALPLPPLELLQAAGPSIGDAVDADLLTENARMLESVLEDFGVRGEIVTVRPGPVVTLYEFQPAPGTKASRVIGLADDIARNMSAVSVRIATIRGKNAIGIELPNAKREIVYLRELLGSKAYDKEQNGLPLVLGKDIGGQPIVVNLERMPHLLIAGTTGSGKSVAINVMILSLIYALPPERCRFIMVDPKMLELSVYDDIPHLLTPVVTDPRKAVVALKWAVREMENRYRAMSTLGVRNIRGYNERVAEAIKRGDPMTRRVQTGFDPATGQPIIEEQALDMRPLPYIVIVVDEMADLMLVAGKDIEAAIQRLAQMARAAGIHLIMATQRPSVDVITGTIKANFPTRISFQVTSKVDSRTILSEGGAEQLLGQGDMLYMAGGGRISRVHGPFVSDEEVQEITEYLRNSGEPDYVDSVTEDDDIAAGIPGFSGESSDDLYDQAVSIVLRERKASTSFLQRHLKIGYNRAASLIDRMEAERLISSANHVGKREVLVTSNTGEYDD